jgi:hypothetical protein
VPAVNDEAEDAVPPEGVHAYVYPGFPPLTLTDAAPSLPPLQVTSFEAFSVTDGAPRLFTGTVAVCTHPFKSVTRQVYTPAESPLAVAAVPPLGDQEYV